MKQDKDYLANNPGKHKKEIEKVKQLLESGETTNIELALQLLKGGGVPEVLYSMLMGVAWFHTRHLIRQQALDLCTQGMGTARVAQLQDKWEEDYQYSEMEMSVFLETLHQENLLNTKEVARLALQMRKAGIKFGLEHQVLPAEDILRKIVDGDYLSLYGYHLNFLPKEIGNLTELVTLDIEGNNFTKVPDEIQNLKKLENIYYAKTPLQDNEVQKLKTFFPTVFARKALHSAESDFREESYEKALGHLNESLALDEKNASAWNMKGVVLQRLKRYEEGFVCFDRCLEINPQYALAWSNKAYGLHRIKRIQESLEAALKGLQVYSLFPQTGRKWECSLYFRKGQALFYLKRLKESDEAYDNALKANSEHGASWYNKACIYACWQQKQTMLECLANAIEINNKYAKEAMIDSDFKEYWENKNFKNLVNSCPL